MVLSLSALSVGAGEEGRKLGEGIVAVSLELVNDADDVRGMMVVEGTIAVNAVDGAGVVGSMVGLSSGAAVVIFAAERVGASVGGRVATGVGVPSTGAAVGEAIVKGASVGCVGGVAVGDGVEGVAAAVVGKGVASTILDGVAIVVGAGDSFKRRPFATVIACVFGGVLSASPWPFFTTTARPSCSDVT